MIKLTFLFICIFYLQIVFAQKETSNWHFSQNQGISFNSGGPQQIASIPLNNTYFGNQGGGKTNIVINNMHSGAKVEATEDSNGNVQLKIIEAVDSYIARNISEGGGKSKSAKMILDLKHRPF